MRYFNVYGPVNTIEHYVVPRRELVADLLAEIERGRYFTIFAPRQMGKTTLLRALHEGLQGKLDYLPVVVNFEAFENWRTEEFLLGFVEDMRQKILAYDDAGCSEEVKNFLLTSSPTTFSDLRAWFLKLHQLMPDKQVVLIIDEFDGTPQAALSNLLQLWRQIYLNSQPPRPLHSVALVGMQNIAALNLGRSSPFNIARQVQLPPFTLAEIIDLFAQYTAETGQTFASGITETISEQTGGHPFLVNRLGVLLSQEIAPDHTQPVTEAHLKTALEQVQCERHYIFETVVRHARQHLEDVFNILFGSPIEFNLNDPVINDLHMQGVISPTPDGFCQIANPIYKAVLLAAFRPRQAALQADILINSYDLRPYAAGGRLQMSALLSQFRQFVERRGREAFKVSATPQEATGQYLLIAYLEAFVRRTGQGTVFTEVPTGDGRLDIIVVSGEQRYVIETKIWRGPEQFDRGLDQLHTYLESEGLAEGYYVVFHACPNVYGKLEREQFEWVVERGRRGDSARR